MLRCDAHVMRTYFAPRKRQALLQTGTRSEADSSASCSGAPAANGGEGGEADASSGEESASVLSPDFVCDSLKAMAVDVSQQISITVGVYAAASRGLGVSYQVWPRPRHLL